MKSKLHSFGSVLIAVAAILTFALAPLAIVGCSGSGASTGTSTASPTPTAASYVTPASVQIAAQLATTSALSFGVQNTTERKLVADDAYAAAAALRSLATGAAPSVAQVQSTITQFGGKQIPPAYSALAGDLGALYAGFYPSLTKSKDAGLVTSYLEALAEGVEAGAQPYE